MYARAVRIASCRHDGRSLVGVVRDERIIDLATLDSSLPRTLRGVLEQEGGLERVAGLASDATNGVPCEEVEFLPVVPDPHAIWCAALTFDSHVAEAPGRQPPEQPLFFLRVSESQTGHRQPLVAPAVSDQLDYEGELAVVIGRAARHVAPSQALHHVAGYSCYNDGSVRDWQRHSSQVTPGKNFERTGAFGPWLVTPEEFGDPYAHTITTRVNGELRQRESIDALRFRIEYLIHYLSTICTLRPGDVIACGTPAGVGLRRQPPVVPRARRRRLCRDRRDRHAHQSGGGRGTARDARVAHRGTPVRWQREPRARADRVACHRPRGVDRACRRRARCGRQRARRRRRTPVACAVPAVPRPARRHARRARSHRLAHRPGEPRRDHAALQGVGPCPSRRRASSTAPTRSGCTLPTTSPSRSWPAPRQRRIRSRGRGGR